MSLRRRFGLEEDGYGPATRIIIIRLEDQSMIGFLVDEVREVVNIALTDIEKPTFKLDEVMRLSLPVLVKKEIH